jgi:cell division protein FtsA
MTNPQSEQPFVFGLDIGTRSVVGIVGYKEEDKFHILASHTVEHNTRAMIDGQIHDIAKVSEAVKEVKEHLEEQIQQPLKDVCIAAAGRVLKTAHVKVDISFSNEVEIDEDYVYSLELQGVEEAHRQVSSSDSHQVAYHCVGYSVVKYYLNDYMMSSLIGHKGKKVSAEVLATFLPQEVIDSLYSVIERVGLTVVGLTLEPIAAINVAIPEQFRLLNIALVDIGAGTSDIAITKDGSIIAYGMIPYAGDEITEQIVHQYLVDFQTAEKVKLKLSKNKAISFKDIMGTTHKYEPAHILEAIEPAIERMADRIADKILELNGNKPTNAVFCVGGGGQIVSFTDLLSDRLQIPKERVALRGSEVLQFVSNVNKKFKKDPAIVTPVGIALSAYNQNSNFIQIDVNHKSLKIYNNNRLTVIDVAVLVGFNYNDLFPKRGKSLSYTLNGEPYTIKGTSGEAAKIIVNQQEVSINHSIEHKDAIQLIEATSGPDAKLMLNQIGEYNTIISFYVNNQKVECPRLIKVNGKFENEYYQIQDQDSIEILNYYTIQQLLMYMDLEISIEQIQLNHQPVQENTLVYENEAITWDQENKMSIDSLIAASIEEKNEEKPANDSSITIKVNGEMITLNNKKEYIFVDVLDYINFDLKQPKGRLITTLNGKAVAFTDLLKSGDFVEIFWEGSE